MSTQTGDMVEVGIAVIITVIAIMGVFIFLDIMKFALPATEGYAIQFDWFAAGMKGAISGLTGGLIGGD
jgi:xanthosine utilization system XapX-like protein